MDHDLESSRLKMLNTFKRTQNSLLQASAVELVESTKNMTLGRPINQLNLDKVRSQSSLQINVNSLRGKVDSSRPSSIGDTVKNSTKVPGLNMKDLQSHE